MRLVPRNTTVINASGANQDDEPFGVAIFAQGEEVLLVGPLLLLAGATAWVLVIIVRIFVLRLIPDRKGTRSSRVSAWNFILAREHMAAAVVGHAHAKFAYPTTTTTTDGSDLKRDRKTFLVSAHPSTDEWSNVSPSILPERRPESKIVPLSSSARVNHTPVN